jgi:hypothetical protein
MHSVVRMQNFSMLKQVAHIITTEFNLLNNFEGN